MIYETLVINAGLIFSLVVAVCLVSKRWRQGAIQSQVLLGMVFGVIGIVSMLFPFTLDDGLIFDARTIVISVAGMFGGPVAALISALLAASCRAFIGGIGTLVGICVIFTSAGLGAAYYQLRRRKQHDISTIELYAFGLVVHAVVLAWMLALPGETKWIVLHNITAPFLLVLPVGLVFLSRLLLRQEAFINNENDLRQTQEKYRSIFETTAELMLWIDRDGKIGDCNGRIDQFLGYTKAEVLGLELKQLIDSANQDTDVDALLDEIFARGSARRPEVRMVGKDGSTIAVSINSSCLHTDLEDGGEAVVVIEDIMGRQKAEKERNQLFDHSIDMLCILSLDGRFKQVNPALKKTLGWDPAELQDNMLKDYAHPDDREKTTAAGRRLKAGQMVAHSRTRFKCKDGSYRWLSWNAYPHLEDGLIFSIARDITDIVQVRNALQESKDQLSAVFNAADNIAFIVTDAHGEKPSMLEFSPGAENIFGCSRTEQIGETIETLLTGTDLLTSAEMMEQLIQAEKCMRYETQLIRKSGESFSALLSIFPLFNKSGDMYAALWVVIDVSDMKSLEKQVSQAQRLEAIGTLAGGIAHDFNNILSSIIGFTELSIEIAEGNPHLADNLNEVLTAGKRAKDLVSQILTFSREKQKRKRPIQPDLIVREATKLLKASLPANIVMKTDWRCKTPIMADASQFHQIVMNLATNAAHAMRKTGGTLDITLSGIVVDNAFSFQLQELRAGSYVLLTVADSGHGISQENITKIFDPFFTTKSKNEGTGLGLSVVHGIVKGSGGAIHVDSQPGHGTIFKIYFPAIKMHVSDTCEDQRVLPAGSEHILFIDDETAIVKMEKQNLKSLGYTVTTRTSSLEALELFKADPKRFDLVISDMTMPQMTGDLLSAAIKKIRPDVPIILCTGFNINLDETTTKRIGIDALIFKPVLKMELAAKIREVLGDDNDKIDTPSADSELRLVSTG